MKEKPQGEQRRKWGEKSTVWLVKEGGSRKRQRNRSLFYPALVVISPLSAAFFPRQTFGLLNTQ